MDRSMKKDLPLPGITDNTRRRSFLKTGAASLALAQLPMSVAAIASDNSKGAFPEGPAERRVGTWAAAATGPAIAPAPAPMRFGDQTLRQIVRTSIGCNRARVQLSNEFGGGPLHVGAARVALRGAGSSIVSGTDRVLRFGGQASRHWAIP
jgi:hypothetical protein